MLKEKVAMILDSSMRLLHSLVPQDQPLPHFSALTPLAAALLSAVIFSIAIQLPYRARLFTTPFMIGAAFVSLWTNQYLRPIPHAPDILSQVICIWIHHSLSVLLIEPIYIPQGAPPQQRRRFIRKIWNDPRRLTTWQSCEKSEVSTSRLVFLCKAVAKLIFYFYLRRFFSAIQVLVEPSNIMADDFAPIRHSFFRRMIYPNPDTPVTMKELHIRAWIALEWIWTSYIKINTYNVVGSIVFVVILRFDLPEEWPDLFGSPLEAYSIQRFWGKFWHPLLKYPCATSGRLVSRKLLRIPAHTRYEKIWLVFWTFFISGVNHAIVAHVTSMEHSGIMADYVRFRLIQFAAGAVELFAGSFLDRIIRDHHDRLLGKVFSNRLVRRVVGYIWVFMVFFCSKPQEQYAKLNDNLK